MTKKYSFEDFLLKTNSENAGKMPLMMGGKPTGHYLMILGYEAKSVQRAKINAGIGYADNGEQVEKVKDREKRAALSKELKEQTEVELALELIVGWSFGDFDKDKLRLLLEENSGLALSVMSFSAANDNYLQKK